jgi:hypothetical protein
MITLSALRELNNLLSFVEAKKVQYGALPTFLQVLHAPQYFHNLVCAAD